MPRLSAAGDRRVGATGVEHAIEAIGLHKTFIKKRSIRDLVTHPFRRAERVRALRGVDLRVGEGEIFGLLGPNGAGKTTILKILSCLVLPDEGRALIGGYETREEKRVKPRIGLVHSDERSFYWRLSGRENLQFFATLYDVPSDRKKARIEELLERVDMTNDADRRFSDYSSGMKQRMAIARALLHDPPILLMDEPTRSLDPASAMSLRRFIEEELSGRDAKTIILATHNLHEAEALCGRIAILVRGLVREVGTVDEVRRWSVHEQRFRVEVSDWTGEMAGPWQVVSDTPCEAGRRLEIVLDEGGRLNDLLDRLIGAGVGIDGCDRIEPDLEDAFSRIIEQDAAAREAGE
jgi:ABC-2 type transport system ATP-binding protein